MMKKGETQTKSQSKRSVDENRSVLNVNVVIYIHFQQILFYKANY